MNSTYNARGQELESAATYLKRILNTRILGEADHKDIVVALECIEDAISNKPIDQPTKSPAQITNRFRGLTVTELIFFKKLLDKAWYTIAQDFTSKEYRDYLVTLEELTLEMKRRNL